MFDIHDNDCPVPHSTVLRNRNGNSSTGQEGTRLVSRAAIISVFFLAGLLHLVSNCLRLLSSSGLGVGRRVSDFGKCWAPVASDRAATTLQNERVHILSPLLHFSSVLTVRIARRFIGGLHKKSEMVHMSFSSLNSAFIFR